MFRILLVDHPEGDATLLSFKDGQWYIIDRYGQRPIDKLDMWCEVIDAMGETEAKTVIVDLMCEEDWQYILRHYHSRVTI